MMISSTLQAKEYVSSECSEGCISYIGYDRLGVALRECLCIRVWVGVGLWAFVVQCRGLRTGLDFRFKFKGLIVLYICQAKQCKGVYVSVFLIFNCLPLQLAT